MLTFLEFCAFFVRIPHPYGKQDEAARCLASSRTVSNGPPAATALKISSRRIKNERHKSVNSLRCSVSPKHLALESVRLRDGDAQPNSQGCDQLNRRFFQTLSESMSPALAMALASTEETSRKPCELTGFSPSEASMDESASK